MVSFDDIAMKARSLIDAQDTGDAADHAPDCTSDNGAHRARSTFPFTRAAFDTAGHPLSGRSGGDNEDCCCKQRRRQDTTFHLVLLVGQMLTTRK
jgi:hypothetical protein